MATRKKIRRLGLLAALVALLAMAGTAAAHPLGNFTISRYSEILPEASQISVLYIVDMAEIPAFQERQAMDADADGAISAEEAAAYAERLAASLADGLALSVNGERLPLGITSRTMTFPPGQGNLPTLRLELRLSAPAPAGSRFNLNYEDGNFADRIGWREIVMVPGAGAALAGATVPVASISERLTRYPADLLAAPLAVDSAGATVTLGPAAGEQMAVAEEPAPSQAAAASRFSSDEFGNLLNRTLDTPAALAAALLVAIGLGAAHALTPGHGKTIVGAYLVGSRGTGRHALFLGVTTTITHTAGVFLLGFLVLFASEFIQPEQLYPWLGVLSGLLVVFIGASILRGHVGHWLAHRRGDAHDHGTFHFHLGKGHHHHHAEGDHDHGHHHTHEHTAGDGHAHDHDAPAGASQDNGLGWRNLLALGISGGLLPCPSALVLMLSAIALRQVGLGMALILAFSVGLAGVLTGIGLMLVYAGRFLDRLPARRTSAARRMLPIASATFVTVAGLAITARALLEVVR